MSRDSGVVAVSAGPVGLAAGTQASGAASWLRDAGVVLAGSAFVAVCAHVAVPLWFTPVPVTLQPFAVLVVGLLVSPRLALGAMIAYLAEGAAGLPVFTPLGAPGMLRLVGPTAGYLMSYPLVAPLVSYWWRRGAKSFPRGLAIAAVGSLVTLAMGAVWLGAVTHAAAWTVLNHAVLPFLPGDALKVSAAAAIATAASRWKRR